MALNDWRMLLVSWLRCNVVFAYHVGLGLQPRLKPLDVSIAYGSDPLILHINPRLSFLLIMAFMLHLH